MVRPETWTCRKAASLSTVWTGHAEAIIKLAAARASLAACRPGVGCRRRGACPRFGNRNGGKRGPPPHWERAVREGPVRTAPTAREATFPAGRCCRAILSRTRGRVARPARRLPGTPARIVWRGAGPKPRRSFGRSESKLAPQGTPAARPGCVFGRRNVAP